MDSLAVTILVGFTGSLLIAGAAYWKQSLSASGLMAAVMLGTALYAAGSAAWFGTLIAFFVSSSLLSKWKSRRKAVAESGYAKSGRRDAGQVAANGGIALLLCVCHAIWPHPGWWAAYIGVLATVTADTWATEVGGLSSRPPRSIVTGRIVSAGTSGGVSALGLAASAAGGLFIGVIGGLLASVVTSSSNVAVAVDAVMAPISGEQSIGFTLLLLIALISGMAGSLADSWLGAVLQVMYRCPACGRTVEKNRHCGAVAVRIRGLAWMTNDAVNAVSSLAGGATALVLWRLLS
ncbi:DUF92 domain-containing protein [Paenibacillus sp. YYML68]|uniref:DUF92 domain-containing protein n=1 Tax=Paenibacillus sp. YYML68 TaxID=2909250 RepID=UPI0024934D72|nr:DUF92 domain-containing protein [Paenibacillus sp. YYML68]